MLAYAGKSRFIVVPMNLTALIRDLTPLLQATTSKKALFRLELDDSVPSIKGDPAQIRQVAMNLVLNAAESYDNGGGTIVVRTGRFRPEREYLSALRVSPEHVLEDVDYVFLEVEDEGCGMDEETQARAFDPFFTRKFTGRGLGLAAVLGIVRTHKGGLALDSVPGRGSVFRVLFPAAPEPALPILPSVPQETNWKGSGTVLVVDDEPSVRSLLKNMLERLGLQVIEAEDGRVATEIFRDRADEIDAVLLDLTMPRMDGAETFRALRQMRPDARVVLMSGYDELRSMESIGATGLAGFLRKPFGINDVALRVRSALEGD
jgi:CheY-like chemotaxis protein